VSVAENLERVLESIRNAERSAGRTEGSVELLAVSKFNPASSVLEAVRAGQTLFGENRVQEARDKFPTILESHPGIALHLIGNLQRNKVRQILPLARCVQSVDRLELLQEIGKRAEEIGKNVEILFEYHTGEESKAGYQDVSSLFRSIDALEGLRYVKCRGFMTMAPWTDDKAAVRASFRTLAKLRDDCATRYPSLDFSELSMGMSADYTVAIEEGSTMVRIGTAIFGARA